MTAPAFSVVVPTCDRPTALAELLERLRPERLSVAPDFYELIVSDDGVTGASAAMVRARFPNVRFYAGPRRGPAANRNYGASRAIDERQPLANRAARCCRRQDCGDRQEDEHLSP